MRIALLSDIHANLPALEAVLDDLDRRRPDALFCLGDLVGYAPWPNEVVDLVRARRIPTIRGNYDDGVGRGSDDCGCAYRAEEDRARGAESIAYTNGVIGPEQRRYLASLPRHLRLEGEPSILLVHGSPRRINEYLYEDRPEKSMRRILDEADVDWLCFGHTHLPFHRVLDGRHAVNTGSVGKPKDGDPRAGYVLLGEGEVEFVRVAYDVERAARAIEESPLPDAFADMLRRGV